MGGAAGKTPTHILRGNRFYLCFFGLLPFGKSGFESILGGDRRDRSGVSAGEAGVAVAGPADQLRQGFHRQKGERIRTDDRGNLLGRVMIGDQVFR